MLFVRSSSDSDFFNVENELPRERKMKESLLSFCNGVCARGARLCYYIKVDDKSRANTCRYSMFTRTDRREKEEMNRTNLSRFRCHLSSLAVSRRVDREDHLFSTCTDKKS